MEYGSIQATQLSDILALNAGFQEEIRELRLENNHLRRENASLRDKISEMEKAASCYISEAVTKAVNQATLQLTDELNKARSEISRLKAIINKDSTNSSKPSSTNGFRNVPNSREKSKRRQGAQKGHSGSRLKLPDKIDELEKKGLIERRLQDHTNGSSEYVSRFTIDLELKVVVTEHRFALGEPLPEGLYNEVSYGEGVKAQTVLLMNEGIVANKRLCKLISSLTRGIVNLSTGTVSKFQMDFANRLTELGELEGITQDLLSGKVMNTDDTAMRVVERIVYPSDEASDTAVTYEQAEKKSYRATVRTHSNERSTLYTVNPQKDKKGIERDGILPKYVGILCHDHESKFYNYGGNHSTCGSHLLRDLKGLRELYNCPWAEKMREFVSCMNDYKNMDLASSAHFCDPQKLSSFEREYDHILESGRSELVRKGKDEWGYSEFNAMLNRLTGFKNSYMLFMRDYDVPFTNNLAERDLRSEKTKEKVSGLFRSWEGIVAHSKIRSFISTAKKRSEDLFSVITQIYQGRPVFST